MVFELSRVYEHDIASALANIAECDADFSGENGEDYLWDKAKLAGYDSNLEYCLDAIKDVKLDSEKIKKFMHLWLDNDDYYINPEWKIVCDSYDEIIAIAFASETKG